MVYAYAYITFEYMYVRRHVTSDGDSQLTHNDAKLYSEKLVANHSAILNDVSLFEYNCIG